MNFMNDITNEYNNASFITCCINSNSTDSRNMVFFLDTLGLLKAYVYLKCKLNILPPIHLTIRRFESCIYLLSTSPCEQD